MKTRLIEFLAYLGIGQTKFEGIIGLSRGYVANIGDSIRESSLAKISAHYPELNINWLKTGEGEMLRPGVVSMRGKNNMNVAGNNKGVFVGAMHGGSVTLPDDAKDKVIEKQDEQVAHMFEAFIGEVRGFREEVRGFREEVRGFRAYIVQQDDHIKTLGAELKEIVKHSYLRNQANMERMDGDRQRLDRQMDQQAEQNKSARENMNRMLDMLDKKL